MNPYVPVLLVSTFAILLGLILSGLSAFMGPKKPSSIKKETFECGVPHSSEKDRMSVKFYLTAIVFILFDIETVFLYTWAKVFKSLGFFGLVEIFIFIIILVAGYIYVLRKGALEWD